MTGTVKYAFGETPSEVIWERWDATLDRIASEMEHFSECAFVNQRTESDDLLTVLDALVCRSEQGGVRWSAAGQSSARQLRIDILAALGIDES